MIGIEKGSLRLLVALLAFAASTLAKSAHAAAVSVTIDYGDESRRELADRLASELSSEGYAVELRAAGEPSPCDPTGARLVSVQAGARAWIRLSEDAKDGETVVASICYLGAIPFLQQASSSAPHTDPRKLALATAEALNGLRSKVPPVTPDPARAMLPAEPHPEPRQPLVAAERATPENSVMAGGAVMANVPGFPTVPAVTTSASLGITRSSALVFDALWPVVGAELTSPEVTASVRTAWLRIGPRLRWAAGDFDLSGAVLAGPALSWATAVADAPRIGAADVTAGAVFSVMTLVEYPRRAPIFAALALSASALVPEVRVKLDESVSEPRGAWPVTASLGLGARWGGE